MRDDGRATKRKRPNLETLTSEPASEDNEGRHRQSSKKRRRRHNDDSSQRRRRTLQHYSSDSESSSADSLSVHRQRKRRKKGRTKDDGKRSKHSGKADSSSDLEDSIVRSSDRNASTVTKISDSSPSSYPKPRAEPYRIPQIRQGVPRFLSRHSERPPLNLNLKIHRGGKIVAAQSMKSKVRRVRLAFDWSSLMHH
jgi:hypothetical protein